MLKQAMYAVPVGALLAAGLWSGTAIAAPTQPSGECTAVQQQLAALQADLKAAVDADNTAGAPTDSQAVITLKSQVQVTLGLVEQKCPPPEDTPTTEPPATDNPTTEPPATDEPPLYKDCAAAIAAGAAPIVRANDEVGYRPELDRDGDGIACEANEGPASSDPSVTQSPTERPSTGGFTQLDQVPSQAAETGGGPA